MALHSFPSPPTHIVRVLPLHRALALLLVEQGNLLGLQSCDGLRSMILGIEMDLLNLEEGIQVIILAGVRMSITFYPPFLQSTFMAVCVVLLS